jgi:ABC-2 type transport system ATP-binding protein
LEASDKLYEEYSLGMRARLSLSRALLTDPPILILDEPTLGLDPPSARTIRSLLVSLAREDRKAVLITTHNMFEAEMICDRVAIINEGIIAGIGTVRELKGLVSEKVSVEILLAGIKGENNFEDMVSGLVGEGMARVSTTLEGRYRVKLICQPGMEEEIVAEVIRKIDALGGKVYRVDIVEPSLEDVFITLTGDRGDTL